MTDFLSLYPETLADSLLGLQLELMLNTDAANCGLDAMELVTQAKANQTPAIQQALATLQAEVGMAVSTKQAKNPTQQFEMERLLDVIKTSRGYQ